MSDSKKQLGQFFTEKSPFDNLIFSDWLKSVPRKRPFLEPFAGSNNIVRFLGEGLDWECFDIEPVNDEGNQSGFEVHYNDSISSFPVGYEVCITNPPYLYKKTATESNLPFPKSDYDNLYKHCLHLCLNNCRYVAAIIPATFTSLTDKALIGRLDHLIIQEEQFFSDTEQPVCLALFGPQITFDFSVTTNSQSMMYSELLEENRMINPIRVLDLETNDPNGEIGAFMLDTSLRSVVFKKGSDMPEVENDSRYVLRLGGVKHENLDEIVEESNRVLNEWRSRTHSFFMSPLRGFTNKGRYRRRLDIKDAKKIISKSIENLYPPTPMYFNW